MDIPFAISARTAHLIGLENFANAEGAIVELVKNSYDADADTCVVVANIKTDKTRSSLYIIDNGTGMTDKVITNHWMTIGTDDKLINARSAKKKRVKSGAKGIGRFALNRLGKRSEMLTFSTETNKGYIWNVNWTSFDEVRILSDVKASLNEFDESDLHSKLHEYELDKIPVFDSLFGETFHGTILRISDLNDNWDNDSLNALLKNLEMLIPSHMQTNFSIYLYNIEDLQWSGKVNPMDYEDYDYKVSAEYNGGDTINIKIERNELNLSLLETKYKKVFLRDAMTKYPYRLEDFRNREVLHMLTINEMVSSDILSQVGKFDFTFYFLKNTLKDDRDRDGNQKYPYNIIDDNARIQWLDRFGGVRIYRDEFRVRPYGENGDDWLGLGRRQAKSPGGAGQKMGGYRIRPNQIAGIVNISRLTNVAFEDKSSREGIQENDVFIVFKNLLLQIISVFEADRNYIMYNLSELFKEEHPVVRQTKEIVQNALNFSTYKEHQSKEAQDLEILAKSYQSLESELNDKEAELSMLRGLASMGISVATFTHELRSVMLRLLPRNELLKNILLKYLPEQQFEGVRFENPYRELENMKEEDEKLNNWLMYSMHSIQRRKRDWVDINLEQYFNSFIESWEPTLHKKRICIHLAMNGISDATIKGFEIDLDSIFNNLITNSISAFLTSKVENKTITITINNDHGFAVIDFIDNGKGLAEEYKNNPEVIFNAFETSTVDNKNNKIGTGMGLFIAKGAVNKYQDASIAIIPVENGFGIRTILKIDNYGRQN